MPFVLESQLSDGRTQQTICKMWECHYCKSGPMLFANQTNCDQCRHSICKSCKKDNDIPTPLSMPVVPSVRSRPYFSAIVASEQHQINPFTREGKLLDLPMLFGQNIKEKTQCNVIPDTGATLNVISRHYLEEKNPAALAGLTANSGSDKSSLNMADGRTISTLGQLTIPCSFLDAPEDVMQVVFHVCSTLAGSIRVVVGKQFLEITKTLTIFAHRMVERPSALHQIPRVMCLSTRIIPSKSQLRISIDSKPCLACPDTGSEIDLFSAAFAEEMKVQVQALETRDPSEIEYADGHHEQLLGKVVVDISIWKDESRPRSRKLDRGTSRSNSEDPDSDVEASTSRRDSTRARSAGIKVRLTRQRTFYVVRALASNVVLGQAFLYSIDAYNTYKYAFVESGNRDGPDTLNGIFVTKSSSRVACTTPTTRAELNAALNEVDQQYIVERRKLDRDMNRARDSSTRRKLEVDKQTLKQKHDLASQKTRKEYDDALAKRQTPK